MSQEPTKPKRSLCKWLKKPLFFGIPIGIFVFIIAIVGFQGVIELSSTNTFCYSCHLKMDTIVQEYQSKGHFVDKNHVNATCADCHVPNDYVNKLRVKISATADIYYMLQHKITKENFEANRMRLALQARAEFRKNDSQNCRNCHNGAKFDIEKQPLRAKLNHQDMKAEGKTCIDCHVGIAHKRLDFDE